MGVAIITPTAGLLPCDGPIGIAQLRGFSRVRISIKNQRYRTSLCRAAQGFADRIGPACEVVLLGSIASTKYLNLLLPIFGERLRVPAAFIGLGDMSRGGLLLRCVREQRELDYIAATTIPAVSVPRPRLTCKFSSPSNRPHHVRSHAGFIGDSENALSKHDAASEHLDSHAGTYPRVARALVELGANGRAG